MMEILSLIRVYSSLRHKFVALAICLFLAFSLTATSSKNVLVVAPTTSILENLPLKEGYDYSFIALQEKGSKLVSEFLKNNELIRTDESSDDYICEIEEFTDSPKDMAKIKDCALKFKKWLAAYDQKIDFVVSRGGDEGFYIGAALRTFLDVQKGIPEEEALKFYDKNIMKKALVKGNENIPTAQFITVNENTFEDESIKLQDIVAYFGDKISKDWDKVVAKPAAEAGSKGVEIFPNDNNLMKNLFNYLVKDGKLVGPTIVEQFVAGPIYRIDGYAGKDGEVKINFSVGYNIPPKEYYQDGKPLLRKHIIGEKAKKFDEFTKDVIAALGMKQSIYHLEAIESKNGELYFLEIGARPGGTLPSVYERIGFNQYKAYVNSQLDRETSFNYTSETFGVLDLKSPPGLEGQKKVKIIRVSTARLPSFLYFEDDLSLIKKEGSIWRPAEEKGTFITKGVFIGPLDRTQSVMAEAQRFYNSLKAKVKIIGGKYNGKIFQYTNKKWTGPYSK